MALIEVIDVKKSFTQGDIIVEALRGVSFEVEQGEFLSVVGPSGSGKTTLLNCLGALDNPTAGRIVLDGEELGLLNKKQLSNVRLYKIGFVFQAYNLIPVLTALENVEYVLLLQGVKPALRRERSRALLNSMGLVDLEHRFPRELSGGQQQRVAVARALVSEPRIVLADEPTANLDSKSADTLLDIMAQMCETLKTTFLFSTHDQRVMDRAERLITLHDGMLAK